VSQSAALGLYLHWPWCARICPYCDFNVYRARGADGEAMTDAMARHIGLWRDRAAPRGLTSLHFGGGTPSLATPDQVAALIQVAQDSFGVAPGAEIGLEANPEDADESHWRAFRAAGVERLSLGVQSLRDDALKALGRSHDADAARRAIALAQEIFPRVSLDLIYARPGQTLAEWEAELDEALALGAGHVSAYQLTIEPGTAFGRQAARGRLIPPEEDLSAEFFELTRAHCEAAGLPAYEVSNFARDSAQQSRHNTLYWRSEDWIAVGPGGFARLWEGEGRTGFRTALRPADYIAAVSRGELAEAVESLTPLDAAREMVVSGLRLTEGLDRRALSTRTGHELDADALEDARKRGFVCFDEGRVRATVAGRLVLDSLAESLSP